MRTRSCFRCASCDRIEDDRVKKEQEAARAKAEAERQAKEARSARTREAEERRIRDEAERARLAREADEQREREEHLRLQEAERRARVEGEMRINEERMRLEMQHKKKHSPVKAVVSVAGVLVADRRRHRIQDVLATTRRSWRQSARRRPASSWKRQEDAGRARGALRDDREGLRTTSSKKAKIAGGDRADSRRRACRSDGRAAGQAPVAPRTPRPKTDDAEEAPSSRISRSATSRTTRRSGCSRPRPRNRSRPHVSGRRALRSAAQPAARVAAEAVLRAARGHAGVRRRRATSTSTASRRC